MLFNNLLQTRKGSSVWDPLSQGGEREEGIDQSTMWPTSLADQLWLMAVDVSFRVRAPSYWTAVPCGTYSTKDCINIFS